MSGEGGRGAGGAGRGRRGWSGAGRRRRGGGGDEAAEGCAQGRFVCGEGRALAGPGGAEARHGDSLSVHCGKGGWACGGIGVGRCRGFWVGWGEPGR